MKNKVLLLVWLSAVLCSVKGRAAEWQWSVALKGMISTETKDHPQAFLWIPPHCKQVKGVVLGQHNMLEEGIFEHAHFRKTLSELDFAEIWVSPHFSMVFDHQGEAAKLFQDMMESLAEVSGYNELKVAPVVPLGHSALASFPWNFGAAFPARTLAMLSIHGDAPLTNMTGSGRPNPDWGNKSIDGIPGLIVIGEYEWLEGRIQPAFAFKEKYPGSCIALLADAGRGHFDYSDAMVDFLCMFLRKAAHERLPKKWNRAEIPVLKNVDPQKGWLLDRWRKDEQAKAPSAPYKLYQGDRREAFWAFDKEMALATESYYAWARGKKQQYIGYCQEAKLLRGAGSFLGYRLAFNPQNDGLTFRVSTTFLDTLQGVNRISGSRLPVTISRICGPVEKLDDTTFSIRFYRMGLNNPKRTGDIWLMASNAGNEVFKPVVQQANLKIPLRNDKGEAQVLTFPALRNVLKGRKEVQLGASSSAGVPVYYYVKEGPAEVDGNTLRFTEIPIRAKYPVKVTVLAWQYGRSTGALLQSAEPVEQSFYIQKQ